MCGIWKPDLWEFWKTVLTLSLHGVPLPHPHALPRGYAGLLFLPSSARRPGRNFRGKRTAQLAPVPRRGLGSREEAKGSWDARSPRSARRAAAHHPPSKGKAFPPALAERWGAEMP